MAVTLVTELQNFICPHPEFVSRRFFFGKADFFSAKRLFFRAARDVSGAHRVPPWARVEIKLKMSFQALSHSPSHERASALTSPPPDFLFISIPQCPQPHNPHHPTQNSNIPYWYCLPSTPSLTLPPSSLKCLQKSNPNIHRKCFRCFKCFGCFRCFISLLDHKTARFWSKSELNPQTAGIVPPPYHGYGKHPKRRFTPLHAKGMLLPASGIDPSLAKATKPAPPACYSFPCHKSDHS